MPKNRGYPVFTSMFISLCHSQYLVVIDCGSAICRVSLSWCSGSLVDQERTGSISFWQTNKHELGGTN